jgi:hypothetical protein
MVNPLLNLSRMRSGQKPPEESRYSTAQAIANNVLAPVAMIGNTLDVATGASSVRDVLTGQNPFDQFTSAWWKDAGNRASGRDVTTAMGLTKPNDPKKWEVGDFAGFGAEVLLDPATYLSGGASALAKGPGSTARAVGLTNRLTRLQRMRETPASLLKSYALKHGDEAGKVKYQHLMDAAKKQGHNLDDIMDKPVGSWLKAHGPFGMGEIGGINNEFLAGTLDSLQKRMMEHPVGQKLGALFDHKVKGRMGVLKQRVFRDMDEWMDEGKGAHFEHGVNLAQSVEDLGKTFAEENAGLFSKGGLYADQDVKQFFSDQMRNAFEKHGDSYNFRKAVTTELGKKGIVPSAAFVDGAERVMKTIRKSMDENYKDLVDMGHKGQMKPATPFHSYFHRKVNPKYLEAMKKDEVGNAFGQTHSTRKREESLQGLSVDTINKIRAGKGKNKNYYFAKDGVQRIVDDFGDELGYSVWKKPLDPKTGKHVKDPVEFVISKHDHARRLKNMDLKHHRDIPMYAGQVVDDIFNYTRGQGRVADTRRFIHHQVGENLIDPTRPEAKHWMTVGKLFRSLDMMPKQAVDYLSRKLRKDKKWLEKQKVSPEFADAMLDLAGKTGRKGSDEGISALAEGWDKWTKAYKENWTLPWIPFHLRNRSGGVLNNLMSGPFQNPIQAAGYLGREAQEAFSNSRFQPNHEGGMLKMQAHGVFGDAENPLASGDVALPTIDSIRGNPLDLFTGKAWQDAAQPAQDVAGEFPWKQLGQIPYAQPVVNAVNQGHKTLLNAGQKAAGLTEYSNRANMFKYLTETQGYTPQQAAKEVERTQFDYSKVTPFERDYLKRAIPFYGFMSNQTKLTANTLAERPGGLSAQLIRAQTEARDPEDVMPAEIANTMALPMGELPDGTKQYLTGFGNPTEAAAANLTLPLDPQGSMLDLLSASHPFVKFPAELATGQTFFQRGTEGGGRPLSQLDPTIGRMLGTAMGSDQPVRDWAGTPGMTQFAEHAIQNLPPSKFLTTARTVADPRKSGTDLAMNLLTPAKKTQISPDRQERLLQAASNEIADELGAGTWTNRYFREEDIARAEKSNPDLAERMKALNALWGESKKKASKRRKEKKAAQDAGQKESTNNPLLRALGR